MPTFKMTIAEDTPLWLAIGELSSKARNAELYRLATTGLIAQGHSHGANAHASSGQVVLQTVQSPTTTASSSEPIAENAGGFMTVDLGEDLKFLNAN